MAWLSPFEERTVAILNNNMRCERNLQYSSRIENYFRLNGWSVRDDFLADLVVISGCGFHEAQYAKVRSALDHLRNQGFPENRVVIMGCLPDTHRDQLKATFGGHTVVLNQEAALDQIITASVMFADVPAANVFRPLPNGQVTDVDNYFFIRIAEGCTSKCTFCVIRKAKGYIRSVLPEVIERQFRAALAINKRKICLIGEDALAYGVDIDVPITALVERLLRIDRNIELHLTSVHAMWFADYGDMLLSLCKEGIVRELRIGLQHVNPQMLRRMGRYGDFATYYPVILKLREECPDLYLEADLIVGFPGETDEMFGELLEFCRNDRCFNRVQHFAYSDVEGAPATRLSDKIPSASKIRRWQELNQVLAERSSYQSIGNYTRMGDVLFKLSQEKDFLFCKDISEPASVLLDRAPPTLNARAELGRCNIDFDFDDKPVRHPELRSLVQS